MMDKNGASCLIGELDSDKQIEYSSSVRRTADTGRVGRRDPYLMSVDTVRRTAPCNDVQSTDLFVLESLIMMFFSIVSIVGLSLEICIVWRSGGNIPTNVKLLFLNSIVCSSLRSIYFFVHALYCLLIWSLRSLVVPLDATICACLGYVYIIFSVIGFYSFFFIGVERLWTTFKFQSSTYNKDDSYSYGLICIFISWLVASSTYVGLLMSNPSFSIDKPVCYCYINNLWPKSGLTYHSPAMIVVQIFTCVFYGVVFVKNHNRLLDFGLNRARQTLTQRFSIWANIRTTKWLTPVTLFHSSVTSLVLVMVNVGRSYFPNGITASYMTYLNLCFLIYAMENALVPVLTMRYAAYYHTVFFLKPSGSIRAWAR
uniref:G-protein coupled receptors family 1 profile domain-containing protein n=1 Tax=Romanomermis culicivorax TaxID=13658 RepID=A0A915LB85_ROMCU